MPPLLQLLYDLELTDDDAVGQAAFVFANATDLESCVLILALTRLAMVETELDVSALSDALALESGPDRVASVEAEVRRLIAETTAKRLPSGDFARSARRYAREVSQAELGAVGPSDGQGGSAAVVMLRVMITHRDVNVLAERGFDMREFEVRWNILGPDVLVYERPIYLAATANDNEVGAVRVARVCDELERAWQAYHHGEPQPELDVIPWHTGAWLSQAESALYHRHRAAHPNLAALAYQVQFGGNAVFRATLSCVPAELSSSRRADVVDNYASALAADWVVLAPYRAQSESRDFASRINHLEQVLRRASPVGSSWQEVTGSRRLP